MSSLELLSDAPPILKGVDATIAGLARPEGTKQDEDGFSDLPLLKTAAPLSKQALTLPE